VLVLAVLIAGGWWFLRPIAPIATGYAAKMLCSGVFVSERPADAVTDDFPDNPLVPFLRTSVDESSGRVDATLLGVWGSTAWFTPGYGCTLAEQRPDLPPATEVQAGQPAVPWPFGDAGPRSTPPELAAAIDTAFREDDPDDRIKDTRAVVVVHEGRLVAERYAEGIEADTPLIGWSMTKSVTNALTGRLVARGVIGIDQTDLLPMWASDDRRNISVEHLLHMATGLEFEEVYDPGTDATRMLFRPGDTGEYAASKPLAAPPGSRWHYSSGNTNILCDVLHREADADADLFRELIFAPLGMHTTVLELDSSGDPVCSSNLYASAKDWARVGQWFLQDGFWNGERLLPDGWVAYSTSPARLDTGDTPYGAHWWLNSGPVATRRMPSVPADAYWASGNEGQQLVVVPSEELVIVRLGRSVDFDSIDWGLEELVAGVIAAL
jgi:hypothetical protein